MEETNNKKVILLKVPSLIKVIPEKFNKEFVEDYISKGGQLGLLKIINNQEKSSAELIEWTDGTWSIKIGEEIFKIELKDMKEIKNNKIYEEGANSFMEVCNFNLYGAIKITNKFLEKTGSSIIGKKIPKIKRVAMRCDPDLQKLEMERIEQEKIARKARIKGRKSVKITETLEDAEDTEEKLDWKWLEKDDQVDMDGGNKSNDDQEFLEIQNKMNS